MQIRTILIPLLALLEFTIPGLARAGWTVMDNASDTVQVAVDSAALYELKENGNVWRLDGTDWHLVDPGTESKQIVADSYLYVLKNNGNIWRLASGHWLKIDNGVATRQIAAAGGKIWALKDNGEIWLADSGSLNWARVDALGNSNNIMIHAYAGYLTVAKYNGDIVSYFTRNFSVTTVGQGLVAGDVVGDGGYFYVRKTDGTLWANETNGFRILPMGSDNDRLCYDIPDVWVKKFNGSIWRFRSGEATGASFDPPTDTKAIACSGGSLYELKFSGVVWRWSP